MPKFKVSHTPTGNIRLSIGNSTTIAPRNSESLMTWQGLTIECRKDHINIIDGKFRETHYFKETK